jgi:hypothetical protein
MISKYMPPDSYDVWRHIDSVFPENVCHVVMLVLFCNSSFIPYGIYISCYLGFICWDEYQGI